MPQRRLILQLCRCSSALLAQAQQSCIAPAAARASCSLWGELRQREQQRWLRSGFSSSAAHGSDAKDSSVTSTSNASSADQQVTDMMEVMLQNPTVMNMMMSRMPPHMRRPEVLRAMMQDPAIRARLAALANETGFASIIKGIDMERVSEGMSAAQQAGIDPAALVQRFQQSPTLAEAIKSPRVMAALMDMASNGADALKKYEGDKEIIEAAMEAGDILQELQEAGGGGSGGGCGSSAGPSATSMAGLEQQLGVNPQELMQRLMARPDMVAKIQDPEVQSAVMEVSQKPWKIVKYMFNTKVMSVLKDMKDLVEKKS